MICAQTLGLICIILQFMHIFLRLCSVLALSSFDCRFVCVERSQEELQRKPNRLKSDDPRQKPANQKEHKTQRSRSGGTAVTRGHHRQPVVFTMASGDARLCTLSALKLFRFPSRLFDFLYGFLI